MESNETIAAALREPPREAGVIAVYLFGSAADGRMHRESDIDVGVLLDRHVHPTARDRFEVRLRLLAEYGTRFHGIPIDVVILNDAPPVLGRRIVTVRPAVYCADPAAEHAFRRDVQLRAADLAPFLRRVRQRKLETMAR